MSVKSGEKTEKKMLSLSDLAPKRGSKFGRQRVGRGVGSGWGKTSGVGGKGQSARGRGSSYKGKAFEGGQMPLVRRLPKVGFHSPFRVEYTPINLGTLNNFPAGSIVDPIVLKAAGLIDGRYPVKVLGKGAIDRNLTVKAHAFSEAAKAAIQQAGGTAELVG